MCIALKNNSRYIGISALHNLEGKGWKTTDCETGAWTGAKPLFIYSEENQAASSGENSDTLPALSTFLKN